MFLSREYPDYKFVDPNSAVPAYLKNDCEIHLRPVQKGCPLRCIDIDGLEGIAPLVYSLNIPVNVRLPETITSEDEAKAFVVRAFTNFDAYILKYHSDARCGKNNLFVSLIEIVAVPEENKEDIEVHKVMWRVLGFSSHHKDVAIVGIDNLLYVNVSTKIDALGH